MGFGLSVPARTLTGMSQRGRPDRPDEPPEPDPERVGGRGGDLADNVPGIGVTHEAARRRQSEGVGADRSWRVGADGEAERLTSGSEGEPVEMWGRRGYGSTSMAP